MGKKWTAICLLILCLSVALSGFAGYMTAKVALAQNEDAERPVRKEEKAKDDSEQETTEPTEATEETEPETEIPEQTPKGELSVKEVAQLCTKSVVNITIKARSKSYSGSEYSETVMAHGTGVIIRTDGYIVTCHHVIDGADSIYVTFDDQTEEKAELIGYDKKFDLAVIRVDRDDLPAAQIGDSDAISAGEGVVIIGNPLGEFGSSVSAGVLSAPTRELTIEGVPLRLMQTDAAVNPGNSGGGMFNMQGQWIAMVNAKMSASGIEGIAFAIPLNTILKNIESIIESGESSKPAVLGVSTKKTTCYIDGQSVDCLEITAVKEDSAAEEAGLQVGDLLLSIDGKKLENNDALVLEIKYRTAGEVVEFEVYRDKETIKITATLK